MARRKEEELEFISIGADEEDLKAMNTTYTHETPSYGDSTIIGSWILKQSKV